MKRDNKIRGILGTLHGFLLFFLLCAFVITCCMALFVTIMTQTMNITLSSEDLEAAAKMTFGNVVFLSFVLSTIDQIRRRMTVDRPVKRIVDAAEKMMQGDFSVRITKSQNIYSDDKFNEIAECFNKMAEELSGTETLRTDFIANVSHELKTPLAVIQNYGTMLQTPGLPEEKRTEYAKAITEASGRLASLITNILKLNKLENQQIAPSFEEYDLSEQVCQCLLSFEDAWERKELHIETDIEDCVTVCSDPEMMSLVWNNLFSNAIKFTEMGGVVFVQVKAEKDHALVRVKDTGCGIPKETGRHIFEKFYQGDTSHATQGNGLGLALVKRVVDITGCDIAVESEVGVGTAVSVKMRRNCNG